MSKLYTQCSGQSSTSASRRGSIKSGVKASVQSWSGSLISRLSINEKDNVELTLDVSNDSCGSSGDEVYHGSIDDFAKLMKLVKNIGIEDVIKVLSKKANKLSNH